MNRIGFLISLISRFSLCRLEQLKRTRIMGYFLHMYSFICGRVQRNLSFLSEEKMVSSPSPSYIHFTKLLEPLTEVKTRGNIIGRPDPHKFSNHSNTSQQHQESSKKRDHKMKLQMQRRNFMQHLRLRKEGGYSIQRVCTCINIFNTRFNASKLNNMPRSRTFAFN